MNTHEVIPFQELIDKYPDCTFYSHHTIETLLKLGKPYLSCAGLYMAYQHIALEQGSGLIRARNTDVAETLHCSVGKIQRIRKILNELNLIETVIIRDSASKKITGHGIQINIIR